MDKQEQKPDQLRPIKVAPDELTAWRSAREDRFKWVQRLVRYLPRGKGWVPRRLGRTVFKNTKGMIRIWNGLLLPVNPDSLEYYIALANGRGCVVTRICERVLEPGDCFFDIGANIGTVSLGLANTFKDQVHIHAFEPQTNLARHLSISAALNGFQNVFAYQTLVGEAEGEADLFVPDSLTLASLKPERNPSQTTKTVRCRMISLDHQIQVGALPPPDVIKVDAEGAEFQIFNGMEHVIRTRSPVIAFEAIETVSNIFGMMRSQLFEYLGSLADYDFYLLGDDPLRNDRIVKIDNVTLRSCGHNFLAVPRKEIEIRDRLLL